MRSSRRAVVTAAFALFAGALRGDAAPDDRAVCDGLCSAAFARRSGRRRDGDARARGAARARQPARRFSLAPRLGMQRSSFASRRTPILPVRFRSRRASACRQGRVRVLSARRRDSLDAPRSARPPRRRIHQRRRQGLRLTAGSARVPSIASCWPASRRAGSSCCARSGLTVEVAPSGYDEAPCRARRRPIWRVGTPREKLAPPSVRGAIASRRPMLAADTVVDLDGRALGKPRDASEAARMLGLLSGREHLVHTAFALARTGPSAMDPRARDDARALLCA